MPLTIYLQTRLHGHQLLDSTSLAVCHTARIGQHWVVAGRATRGKTAEGWSFGLKLHLVVTDRGELLTFCLTPGNVDDRRSVHQLLRHIRRCFDMLLANCSDISQLVAEQLLVEHGVSLIPKLRRRMRNWLPNISDKLLLRKRTIIETIYD